MKYPGWQLACLMTATLVHGGACAMEDAMPDAAQDLANEAQAAVLDPAVSPVTEVTLPTADGQAAYSFRFDHMAEGPILTTITSPLDHPMPIVPTECALDTFLRVVSGETLVPSALIEHCLSPADRVALGLPGEGPVTVRAGFLQEPDAPPIVYAPPPVAQCYSTGFQERVDELEEQAAYQPIVPTSCGAECELGILWSQDGCAYVDEDFNNLGSCSALDYAWVLGMGLSGHHCLDYGEYQCQFEPDPACAHTEHVYGDWGPYSSWWQRTSNGQSETTRVRVEVASCDPNQGVSGWWRVKQSSGGSFGPQNPVYWGAGTYTSLTLSAGWNGNDEWRGWDFQIRAEGSGFRVISAWTEMQGKDRFECPIIF